MKKQKFSYHDLEIETAHMSRTSIFDLPYGLEVTCTKVGGWQLWNTNFKPTAELLAGEYDENWLRLFVGGATIVDSSENE